VVKGQVELQDLLYPRAGGIVRMEAPGMVTPLITNDITAGAMTLMEWLETVRENRTGVTRYNQGLDAQSLNKTATGITRIMAAAQARLRLIARVFAETGVKRLFKLILKIITTYQDKERVIRLRNQWVSMDPRTWNPDMDVTVAVGLGVTDKEQLAAHLTNILQTQMAMLQAGIPVVTPENIYNTLTKLTEAVGFKEAGQFFTDPQQLMQLQAMQQQQPQEPPPEVQFKQAELELKKQELALRRLELEGKLQLEGFKLGYQTAPPTTPEETANATGLPGAPG
jgi:hypothetical protein